MSRPKPTPPKQKPQLLSAATVGQLSALLDDLPDDARIYERIEDGEIPSCLEVWIGKRVLARITLTGY